MNNDLKKAMIISAIINSVMFFTEFHKGNYDSYVHMFFADHYRRSWFDTWEPKWYGGFRVTTYPPLSHQLLAILAYTVEMELAYRIFTFLTIFLLPISIYYFSKVFVSDRAAGYASLISVFTPSAFIATYIFGQLPTLLSFITTLFTASCLDRFLKKGRKHDLARVLCLLGTSISIHHFTAIFFLPFLIFTIMVTAIIKEKSSFENVMKRSLLFIISAIIVSATVILPFWSFLGSASMQTPIPHFTRTSILENGLFGASILAMYGGTVVLFPLVIPTVRRQKGTVPLFSLVTLMSVLGLGGTTVLPHIMFGEVWKWLTYDRFTLWASLTFLPLLGLSFSKLIDALKEKLRKGIVLYLSLVLLLFSFSIAYGWWTSSGGFYGFDMRADMQVDLEEIVNFLSTCERWNWRYLTLGFGEASMVKLSILTNATTIDGFYSTGRTLPILTSSGISTIDSAKFYENGFYVLEQVLENAPKYSLKWIFCNDQAYEPILKRTGFLATQTFRNGVTLWEKNDIPRVEYQNSRLTLLDYCWGIMPLLLFIISVSQNLPVIIFKSRVIHPKLMLLNIYKGELKKIRQSRIVEWLASRL